VPEGCGLECWGWVVLGVDKQIPSGNDGKKEQRQGLSVGISTLRVLKSANTSVEMIGLWREGNRSKGKACTLRTSGFSKYGIDAAAHALQEPWNEFREFPVFKEQRQSMTSQKVNIVVNRSMRLYFSMLICFFSLSATVVSQAKQSSPVDKGFQSNKILTFDVVSIRRSGKDETGGMKILPDGYQAKGMSIDDAILLAYLPAPYFKHRDELKGGPSWVYGERYDIEAKISPSDLAAWQSLNQNMMQTPQMLQAMLRAMLIDRFKLVIHRAPTQVDGYALMLSNRKLRLEKERTDDASTAPGMQLLDGGKTVNSFQDNKPVWTFSGTSMAAFVGFLSLSANGPLVDRTGLRGKYHFSVSAWDQEPATSEQGNPAAPDPDRVVPLDIEALGLKLDRIKVPADSWVIDHIQRPSAN
jgi:uncharacterized protein (TIGR03435 family)